MARSLARKVHGFSPLAALTGGRLRQREIFYRTLARALGGGIPLAQALELCERSSADTLAARLSRGVGTGLSLGEASQQLAELPVDERTTIEAAEKSGRLEAALQQLAGELENQRAVIRETVSRSLYPLLVLHLIPLVAWIPLVVVEPHRFFTGLSLSYAGLWAAMALVFLTTRWLWTSRVTTRWVLALPGPGNLLRISVQRRFLRSLYWLYAAGVGFREAVETAALGIREEALTGLQGLRTSARNGESIDTGLSHLRNMDPLLLGELMTAAHVGGLEAALQRVLGILQERQRDLTRRLGRGLSAFLYGTAITATCFVTVRFYLGYIGRVGEL